MAIVNSDESGVTDIFNIARSCLVIIFLLLVIAYIAIGILVYLSLGENATVLYVLTTLIIVGLYLLVRVFKERKNVNDFK